MSEIVKRNIGSLLRLALGCIGAWLAKKGIEVDDASVDAITGALMVIASAAWSVWKNRRKNDEGKEGESQKERRKTDEEEDAG